MARATAVAMSIRSSEVARRLLWGQPHTEIMAELGLTYNQFHTVVDSPAFQDELRRLQRQTYQSLDDKFRSEMDTVQSKARGESITAIDTLIGLMKTSASEQMKRDCARDVIEYAGQGAQHKAPIIQINAATVALIERTREEDDGRREWPRHNAVSPVVDVPAQEPGPLSVSAKDKVGFVK